MKRLLGLLLVMGMVGCGGGDSATTQPDESATPLPDSAKTQPDASATPLPDAATTQPDASATSLPDAATTQPDANATPQPDSTTTQPDASVIPLPDAATVKQTLTPAQLAVGDPIENSIGMVLVPIPAGEFLMGSPETEPGRRRVEVQHQVTLTKPFLLGLHEVTQGQWQAVMGTTPWKGKEYVKEEYVKEGDDYPATYVNWDDAVEFCRQLSEKEGLEYRLPTEAEWEYACRAGTTTAYCFGDDASELGEYAWYKENAVDVGQVGQKEPNPWGLYDMHGNVWEWCSDWGGDYPSGSTTDPTGAASGSSRVCRGGSWYLVAGICRSAFRYGDLPSLRNYYLGFRVALSPSGQ